MHPSPKRGHVGQLVLAILFVVSSLMGCSEPPPASTAPESSLTPAPTEPKVVDMVDIKYLAPEAGGPRNWEAAAHVTLREQASVTSTTVASLAASTVFDNLGCQVVDGQTWCDVQTFGGGPRGLVPADGLKPAVSPDGSVATGEDTSASRAGQGQFDATGKIPCAQNAGQPMGQCDYGVARAGGGYATVVIQRGQAPSRAIFFRMGKPVGADTSQADGYPEFSITREGDLHMIKVGNERYEIPDAVIYGG